MGYTYTNHKRAESETSFRKIAPTQSPFDVLSSGMTQAVGDVGGGGFLNHHVMGARIGSRDTMAAADEHAAMPTAALSFSTAAAAGPIQAAGKGKEKKPQEPDVVLYDRRYNEEELHRQRASADQYNATQSYKQMMMAQKKNDAFGSQIAFQDYNAQLRKQLLHLRMALDKKVESMPGTPIQKQLALMQDPEYQNYQQLSQTVYGDLRQAEESSMVQQDPMQQSYLDPKPFDYQLAAQDPSKINNPYNPSNGYDPIYHPLSPKPVGPYKVISASSEVTMMPHEMGEDLEAEMKRLKAAQAEAQKKNDPYEIEKTSIEYQRTARERMIYLQEKIRRAANANNSPFLGGTSREENQQRLANMDDYKEYAKLRDELQGYMASGGQRENAFDPMQKLIAQDPSLMQNMQMQAMQMQAMQMQAMQMQAMQMQAMQMQAMGMGMADPSMAMMQPMGMADPSMAMMQSMPDAGAAASSDSAVPNPDDGLSEIEKIERGLAEAPADIVDEEAAADAEMPAESEAEMPAESEAPVSREAKKEHFEFASEQRSPDQLSSDDITGIMSMPNLVYNDEGAAFSTMMDSLRALSAAKGNPQIGNMASEAMTGNSYDAAIAGMKQYRKKLKLFGSDAREQRGLLKGMIQRAKADRAAWQQRQSTTLDASEKTGSGEGGINTVSRYTRGGKNAFFKPLRRKAVTHKEDEADELEREVMKRIGIRPAEYDKRGKMTHDPRLANREIAFSRLGALLGSSVTLDAKKATDEKGRSGVLTEEAPGKAWMRYNWNYFGVKGGAEKDYSKNPLISQTNRANLGTLSLEDRNTADNPNFAWRDLMKGSFAPGADTLDVTDSDYQRQMNELFLLDTLAGHTDRHADNYHVARGEDGKISVKAIDNDLTFGALESKEADQAAFGKRGTAHNYGGLPAQMQIDAGMAQRIRSIERPVLDQTFSDLLEPKEIDALWTRFEMMKKYIQAMEENKHLVSEWTPETAKKELLLAGGIGSYTNESRGAGGYAGNNYFQRQLLALNAADTRDMSLMYEAAGMMR